MRFARTSTFALLTAASCWGCASGPQRDQALDDLNRSLTDMSRTLRDGSQRLPSQPYLAPPPGPRQPLNCVTQRSGNTLQTDCQ